jgi:hypothetical protein
MRRSMLFLAGLVPIASSLGAQTLTVPHRTTPSSDPTISVYVDGNVKNAVGGTATNTAVVSGALGLRYVGSRFTTSGQINIAAKTDTLSTGFGTALLSPGSGKAFNSGLIDVRTRAGAPAACSSSARPLWCRMGVHGYASASTTRWATAKLGETVTAATDVPVIGSGIGGYYSFFDGKVKTDSNPPRVAMVLDATLTHRHIAGDISGDDAALTNTIGEAKQTFLGVELGLSLSYNQIRAGLSYYLMNGDVKGFSGGQIVAGFALKADLLTGKFEE